MRLMHRTYFLLLISFFTAVCSSLLATDDFLDIDRTIRVGLKSLGRHKTFKLEPSNGYIEIFDNQKKQAVFSGKASVITVKALKKNLFKITIDGKKNFLNLKNEMLFSPVGRSPNYLKAKVYGRKNRSYRGSIAIEAQGRYLFAINQIDMENYLKSVVPSEIYNSAPDASMQAQAVAARTYAVRNIDRHRKHSNYDICDTVHCQAYKGMVKEIKAAANAVKETYGKILTFNHTPANTVYHANCGGILICSTAAWGGRKVPYLVSHRDGVKGKPLFCTVGKQFKRRKLNKNTLQKPVKNLVVKYFPSQTRKKYHSNFGHRVGMCQDGSIGMGAIGYSYREILGFYYPGTRLVTLNYAREKIQEPEPPKLQQPPERIVIAMKPSETESTANADKDSKTPLNPTQQLLLKTLRNSRSKDAKSVLNTLKEISQKQYEKKTDFKKVFFNNAQPNILKSSSRN
ncbi:MAG: SpoIID/LytB domain-containing protein [Candidatus Rifleibacteriota bacterium]